MTTRIRIVATPLLCLAALAAGPAPAADFISIGIGQVSVVHASQSIGTVAVGDPKIADVAIEGDAAVVVFGKKPGQTDLVLMSHNHRLILRQRIVVGTAGGPDTVVVRRPGETGISDEGWFCAPNCVRVGEK